MMRRQVLTIGAAALATTSSSNNWRACAIRLSVFGTTTGRLTAHRKRKFPSSPVTSGFPQHPPERMPGEGELNEPETSNGALFR
jgi:hypothetical protein